MSKQSKPSAKNSESKPKLVIDIPNGKEKDWHVAIWLTPQTTETAPPEPRQLYSQAWYDWYYKYGNGRYNRGENLWSASIYPQESCCSFDVLSDLTSEGTLSKVQPYLKEIGEALDKKLKMVNRYVACYVPNIKDYEVTKAIVQAAGFMEGISTKSHHGRYTNTRWEWFPSNEKQCIIPSNYAPKLRKNEKTVSALAV